MRKERYAAFFLRINPDTFIHPVDSLSAVELVGGVWPHLWPEARVEGGGKVVGGWTGRREEGARAIGRSGAIDGGRLRVDVAGRRSHDRSAHNWGWSSHHLNRSSSISRHCLTLTLAAADIKEGKDTHEVLEEAKSSDRDRNASLHQVVSRERRLIIPVVDSSPPEDFKSAENNHGRTEDKCAEEREYFKPTIRHHWIAAFTNCQYSENENWNRGPYSACDPSPEKVALVADGVRGPGAVAGPADHVVLVGNDNIGDPEGQRGRGQETEQDPERVPAQAVAAHCTDC